MQRISPFLWFDNEAEEAVKFYTSLFKDSGVVKVVRYGEAGPGPKGTVMTIDFRLAGQDFAALNGGPVFKFTPATSFFVTCESEKEVDDLYSKLSKSGGVLMPLNKYPFSDRYAWVSDRYGVSWQLFLGKPVGQKIIPCLMFVKEQHGKAEEAMNFYAKIFKKSKIDMIARYEKGEDTPGTIKHGRFSLEGGQFIAMDSGLEHKFTFSEATSFVVKCKNQKEVDYFWEKLTDGGEEVQCGWLKDRYGVSWQIVPIALLEMIGDKDPKKAKRVAEAMFKMKKIEIGPLKKAYDRK